MCVCVCACARACACMCVSVSVCVCEFYVAVVNLISKVLGKYFWLLS